MMAITTNSSTNVKPAVALRFVLGIDASRFFVAFGSRTYLTAECEQKRILKDVEVLSASQQSFSPSCVIVPQNHACENSLDSF
jgi:hypothetical protein